MPSALGWSCVDEQRFVGAGRCFDLAGTVPSSEAAFHLPVFLGAPAVLWDSRATHSALEPDERDIQLTRWPISGGEEYGVVLGEHILVYGKTFRAIRDSIEEGLI